MTDKRGHRTGLDGLYPAAAVDKVDDGYDTNFILLSQNGSQCMQKGQETRKQQHQFGFY